MPLESNWYPKDYPTRGWSNAFGDAFNMGWPWSAPWGFTVQAPGSTGRFVRLNSPMKFTFTESIGLDFIVYSSGVKFTGSDLPAFIVLTSAVGDDRVRVLSRMFASIIPPTTYWGEVDVPWFKSRETTIALTGDWFPIPLFDTIGSVATLRPWNRAAFEKLV